MDIIATKTDEGMKFRFKNPRKLKKLNLKQLQKAIKRAGKFGPELVVEVTNEYQRRITGKKRPALEAGDCGE